MRRLVFHLGHSAGFYSEFNNMVLAILYCQRHNIAFELYSADANFRIKRGWQDYFLPFCNESINPVHHYINHRFDAPKGGKRKLLYDTYKRLFPNNCLMSELWNDFRHIDHSELTTSEVQKLSAPIINDIYRFNPSTQKQIENLISTINLCCPYIGFHIRGGDKQSEHDLLSIDKYISRAEKLSDIRQGLISTDDYRNFETLCEQYPNWKFYTLTPNTSQGYHQDRFTKLTPQQKYDELLIMFASMELLCHAKLTICTYSSNIGMFLGMRMGDRAIGVDMDNWMIW